MGLMVKLKKNKVVSARIDKDVFDLLSEKGITIQKILDEYIKESVNIDEIMGVKNEKLRCDKKARHDNKGI